MSELQPPSPEPPEESPPSEAADSLEEFDLPFTSAPRPPRRAPLHAPGAVRAFLFFTAAIIVGSLFGQLLGLGLALRLLGRSVSAHHPTLSPALIDWAMKQPLTVFCVGAASLLLTLVVALVFTRGWERRALNSIGFQVDARAGGEFVAGLALGAALITLVFVVEEALGWLRIVRIQPPTGWPAHLLVWFVALLPAAATEEVTLRGYTFQALQEQWGGIAATLITALIFGALHGINPHAGWASFAGILFSGVLFGVAYLVTRRLWLPIGLHVAWNLFEGPVLGFPVSGLIMPGVLTTTVTGPTLWTGGAFGPEAGLLALLASAAGALLLAGHRRPVA